MDYVGPGAPRRLSILERAYELARTGACRSVEEIAKRLKQEQYESVETHLGGSSLRKELRQLCADARARRLSPDAPTEIAAE
jgi:chaperonin GroEL (HSP60 family)